jgi:hypothetical protein
MKILINSFPRSGSNTFTGALRKSVWSIRNGNLHEREEYDEWIINKYEPLFYLGDYGSNVTLSAIVRNPIDAITSNTERWFKGFTGNVIDGVQIVNKKQQRSEEVIKLDSFEIDFIQGQIKRYGSYLNCIEKNFNNIRYLTYEQTREQTDIAIKNLLILSNVDISKIEEANIAKNLINNEKKHPVYAIIKEYLYGIRGISDHYDQLLLRILDEQAKYPLMFTQKNGII